MLECEHVGKNDNFGRELKKGVEHSCENHTRLYRNCRYNLEQSGRKTGGNGNYENAWNVRVEHLQY